MHRGKLEVLDSSLGGARFQVTLPNQRLYPDRTVSTERKTNGGMITGIIEELRPGSVIRRESEASTPQTGRTTVLVVEDNSEMNRFISQSLRAKYSVICAFNGQEGLEKALAVRPTLIVSDIMMPVMSGVEMIAEIRKRPELADTPILILSAKADEELKIKLLEEGTQDFITKPFSEKDLLVRIRNLISIRQAQERERQETAIAAALYRVAASFANELDQQKLLQLLFVQGRRTSERAEGGLGIGLALVRNIVELHGGRVDAKSDGPGRGSEFSIELPAALGTMLARPPAESESASEQARLQSQVLLVDDNVDAAQMLAEGLRLLGHEVIVAHDGPQALAAAENFRAAAALLDIGLPVMDGYELARLLRERWRDHAVRFIAITGYGQETDKAKAFGFDAHLVKPVNLAELAALLGGSDILAS